VGILALALALLLNVAAAIFFAACLRFRSLASFVLSAYLLGWTQLLAVMYALSLAKWLTRPNLLLALTVLGIGACLTWSWRGKPVPPLAAWRIRLAALSADPMVRVLGVAIVVIYAYTLALAILTAPNDGDPLVYELTRAALWRQQHAVGWLGTAYDSRLDVSPPHAEMGSAATMILSGSDRFVALGQFTSVFALSAGVAGIGARVGFRGRDAAFGALLVPFIPVVLLQSWTGFTDLVFASFLVAAAYFSLGSKTVELIPFGLAAGLALGTKFLGPILLPLVAILVVVAQPIRRLTSFALAGLAGLAFGSIWYVNSALHAGNASGGVNRSGFQPHTWRPILGSIDRYVTELFDLSGAGGTGVLTSAGGTGVLVYPLTGLVLVGAGLWRRRRARSGAALIGAGLLVAALPIVIALGHRVLASVSERAWRIADVFELEYWFRQTTLQAWSDGAESGFGPVAAALAIATLPLALWAVRRRELRPTAGVLAAAPALAIVGVSVTIVYERYQGRYFASAIALSAGAWGVFARWGATRVGVAAASIVTAALCLVNSLGKPTGIDLLGGYSDAAVWRMPRWEQQGVLRPSAPERGEIDTIRFVETSVPPDARIGLALRENDFGFPYFGPRLQRHVAIVDVGDVLPPETDWLVAAPGRRLGTCPDAWQVVQRRQGWRVLRRTSDTPCRAET
jgi:hypothetical protein